MVESADSDWKCLAILWEKFNKMGLCLRSLRWKALMVVNYSGMPTDSDQVILQRLQRCNVVYLYNLSYMVLASIATVHSGSRLKWRMAVLLLLSLLICAGKQCPSRLLTRTVSSLRHLTQSFRFGPAYTAAAQPLHIAQIPSCLLPLPRKYNGVLLDGFLATEVRHASTRQE
jgi:hypothetical protein